MVNFILKNKTEISTYYRKEFMNMQKTIFVQKTVCTVACVATDYCRMIT